MKQADRFETVYRQKHIGATLDVVEILADRETGVQYLFYQSPKPLWRRIDAFAG